MAIKERYSNPACLDTINLRLFVYNSNNFQDVDSVQQVDIYFLDPDFRGNDNKDGRRLVQTFAGSLVTQLATGQYLLVVPTTVPTYTIGQYRDVWTVTFPGDTCTGVIENQFQIYPDLWLTTPIPIVYDFGFAVRPNKLIKGSKRYLICEVTPNVPRASDLARYYENLAIVADLKISIEFICGDCVPREHDLRLIVDRVPVDFREKKFGYFFLDTTELECGIYNVWFEMSLG